LGFLVRKETIWQPCFEPAITILSSKPGSFVSQNKEGKLQQIISGTAIFGPSPKYPTTKCGATKMSRDKMPNNKNVKQQNVQRQNVKRQNVERQKC
jgi:hypothetical protein